MLNTESYTPPKWMHDAIDTAKLPAKKVKLANLPTPIHKFRSNELESLGLEVHIKRDDLTSCDLSGNKVRKLEFLLSEAIEESHDCVITIGGEQSNHCRATAVACRQLGIDPYIIIRTDKAPSELSLTGNLLLSRMVGSHVRTVSPDIYYKIGSDEVVHQLAESLKLEGKNPYCIPVGGSNVQGTFGYLNAMAEIASQCGGEVDYDHIVFACGSGGTAAGIAIGNRLLGSRARVHAVCVCDTPDEFYESIGDLAVGLGIDISPSGPLGSPRDWLDIYPGEGLGYALTTDEELNFLCSIASESGLLFDQVYSGKALYHLMLVAKARSDVFQPGHRVLFIHTGGILGLYNSIERIRPQGSVQAMNLTD
mmetsp:Transcript_13484/g.20268  ORF Transcript_13484/g.20268 Transcript_13484/m.20268 type:complete len:366 (+) Transcript_13484:64-1161(+)|eukprot:CAMPEP_0185022114 /NCGR_PEP_ID=MMETSP1103-20130426/4846_1 /TAXON_ID=36769 /ORGANISM="Paraphysomonas bandaiensis, Strain Caron Lab Isolate" /LENGTH=365 /DNA_ID=CAMNT_0027554063 /DNA_START=35 /DNA_END=1132 /DNA_ORIENTATION=+